MFSFVVADVVIQECEGVLERKIKAGFGGARRLREEFDFLLKRLHAESVPHVSEQEFLRTRPLIRHVNDIPVLAAAIKSKPDWLVTNNTSHFDQRVAAKTGLQIVTPQEFLRSCGKLF